VDVGISYDLVSEVELGPGEPEAGFDYDHLIGKIVESCRSRYGI
jgi:hypothetical protein